MIDESPAWAATSEDTVATMAAWSADQGLSYERLGLLPGASDYLRTGTQYGIDGWSASMVQERGVPDGRTQFYSSTEERPVRFSESLCSGALPGGLEGTLAHHSGVHSGPDQSTAGSKLLGTTAVVMALSDARRVTRELVGRPRVKGLYVIGPDPEKVERELSYTELDLTPSLGDRYTWQVWSQDGEALVRELFDSEVVDALGSTPEHATVTLRDGMLVVEANGYLTDPDALDSLLRPASLLAERLRRAAGRQPRLDPGVPLTRPPDTPLQRWTVEGAARLPWPQPPTDVAAAVAAYESGGRSAARPVKRGPLRRLLRSALLPLATADSNTSASSQAWGLEAFAAGYARARGLELEDPEELRRRLPLPFPGTPERCLRGPLAESVEGRLILWRDGTDVGEQCFLNLGVVPASGGSSTPAAPFAVRQVDGWLVIAERVDAAGRSIVRLDALAADSARRATQSRPRGPTT